MIDHIYKSDDEDNGVGANKDLIGVCANRAATACQMIKSPG